ncbi:MAG: hypothetical protein AB1413_13245, partial [Thermodesulfobacteriota bacterium]
FDLYRFQVHIRLGHCTIQNSSHFAPGPGGPILSAAQFSKIAWGLPSRAVPFSRAWESAKVAEVGGRVNGNFARHKEKIAPGFNALFLRH